MYDPENPYNAAQRFLEKHDLPLSYIDQVVAFIEKNAQNVTIGPSREEYMDPFTGWCLLHVVTICSICVQEHLVTGAGPEPTPPPKLWTLDLGILSPEDLAISPLVRRDSLLRGCLVIHSLAAPDINLPVLELCNLSQFFLSYVTD
jgi:hypothetical protein